MKAMDGKIVIITGATSGIGRETARALTALGATVGVVGRNAEKGVEIVADLRKTAKYPDQVSFLRADFASLDEVRGLAKTLHERFERIDVLVNNAGVINAKRRVTVDDLEETIAVNHFAHFALTGLVLDLLQTAPQVRIINTSSGAHLSGRIDLDDLQHTRRYSAFGAYGASKLANLLFTFELARRLEGTAITVNAFHPGFVASGFASNNGRLARTSMLLLTPFAVSSSRGAETAIYLAAKAELATVTGRYFYQRKQHATSRRAHDLEAMAGLWEASEVLTGVDYGIARVT